MFALGGYYVTQGKCYEGHTISALTSGALAGSMTLRYVKTRKPMPAIPLALAGILSGAYQASKSVEWKE